MNITPAQLDRLGIIADQLDNVRSALDLPLDDKVHIRSLKSILPNKSEDIKNLYREISNDNPWDK